MLKDNVLDKALIQMISPPNINYFINTICKIKDSPLPKLKPANQNNLIFKNVPTTPNKLSLTSANATSVYFLYVQPVSNFILMSIKSIKPPLNFNSTTQSI